MNKKICSGWRFRLALWGSFVLLGILCLCFDQFFFAYGEKDVRAYSQLVESTTAPASQNSAKPYSAQQTRNGVRKDIFFTKGEGRLGLRVTAVHSVLELDQRTSSLDLVEQLSGVQGLLQEELYYHLPDGREALSQSHGRLLVRNGDPAKTYDWVDGSHPFLIPMQMLRYFEAEKATYHYKNNQLEAEGVTVASYKISGHAFPASVEGLKPTMSGIAHTIELSLDGPSPQFKARQLKAAYYQGEEG